jgi:hypothetical protein
MITLTLPRRAWTDQDFAAIREWYAAHEGGYIDLDALAVTMGRSRAAVAVKASRLGLCDQSRMKVPGEPYKRVKKFASDEARAAATSARIREYIRVNGHPRGALGMKHTPSVREQLAELTRQMNAKRTPAEKELYRLKANASKLARYGSAAGPVLKGESMYTRAKGGRRPDLDNRYFRSAWEANYARYLRWLLAKGEIVSWEYEPETFVFHGVTRGVLSYTPDFRVTDKRGVIAFHEVKGWMDNKSKAKLKRMAEFYPEHTVIVIGPDEYKALAKWSALIGGWE